MCILLPSPAQFPAKDYWTLSAGFAPEMSYVHTNWACHQFSCSLEVSRQGPLAARGQQAPGTTPVVQVFSLQQCMLA